MAIIRSGAKVSKPSTESSSSSDDEVDVRPTRRPLKKATFPLNHHPPLDAGSSGSTDSGLVGGTELCQLGDSIFTLPCELFDLPDPSQVLSLDAWNFRLTEEERESLCMYLPNMDETTFRETLTELLEGETFHFNSPLSTFFQQLKDGIYHPQVAQCREALLYLERKEHYHLLRKYHNEMVNYFSEMQAFLQGCPHSDLEEKLPLWMSWKHGNGEHPSSIDNSKEVGPLRQRLLAGQRSDIISEDEMSPSPPPPLPPPEQESAEFEGESEEEFVPVMAARRPGPKQSSRLKKPHPKFAREKSPPLPPKPFPVIPVSPEMDTPEMGFFGNRNVHETPSISSAEDKDMSSEDQIAPMDQSSEDIPSNEEDSLLPVGKARKRKTVETAYEKKPVPQSRKREKLDSNAYNETVFERLPEEDESVFAHEQGVSENFQEEPIFFEDSKPESAPRKKCQKKKKEIEPPPIEDDSRLGTVMFDQDIDELVEKPAVMGDSFFEENDTSLKEEQKPVKKKGRKRPSGEVKDSFLPALPAENMATPDKLGKKSKKTAPLTMPEVALRFPFSLIQLISEVRSAMMFPDRDAVLNCQFEQRGSTEGLADRFWQSSHGDDTPGRGSKDADEKSRILPPVRFLSILERVRVNICDTQEPLDGLVREVLKVLSCKTPPAGMKDWKPYAFYDKPLRAWAWVGPVSPVVPCSGEIETTAEAWGVSQKSLYKILELCGNALRQVQDILCQLGELYSTPLPLIPSFPDEKERFKEMRAQKSLSTILPSSDDMRARFRREESIRYTMPDRAFAYTAADGRRSVVAPLRRSGGAKPSAKVRDHFMLKPDRPPHVTVLCIVRDAAARLPGSIGTRADVCTLIRDSHFIVEDVSDAQLNQVVSGALDRLHYERDPCVRYDSERKLWVYLHFDRDEEDFEDDATSSTKRWKRTKKDSGEQPETPLVQDYGYSGREEQDGCSTTGLDFSSPPYLGGPSDLSNVYSADRPEFVYGNSSLGNLGLPGNAREDGLLSFIDLPPSIQPACVNMPQSHPMGWEVLGDRWEREPFPSHNQFEQGDFNGVADTSVQGDVGLIVDTRFH